MISRIKTLALVLSGVFLPFTTLHALPAASAPTGAGAIAGKLEAGTTFNLKVTGVSVLGGKKAPGWIPVLRKGQSVKIKIGPDGRLILLNPRFGIPFAKEFRNANSYIRPAQRVGRSVRTAAATLVTKPSAGRSTLILTFSDTFFKDPGQLPIDIGVIYDLN